MGIWVTGGGKNTTQIYTKDKVWIDGPVLPVRINTMHCAVQLDAENTLLAGGEADYNLAGQKCSVFFNPLQRCILETKQLQSNFVNIYSL